MQATVKPGARIPEWERELTRPGFTPWCFESSGSTMDLARELAASLPPDAQGVVISRLQLGGRGRQGRQWVPPESGFYATYVCSFDLSPEHLAGLSLAVGVILSDALGACGADVLLKWPNDVLHAGGDKLAGVLIESVHREGVSTVLVGIGVNLAGEPRGVEGTSSVQTVTGRPVAQLEFAKLLTPLVLEGLREFRSRGFEPFRDRFSAKAAYLGARITIDHGNTKEEGIFRGVDLAGALRLEIDGELVSRASGEVKNLRPVSK